MTDNVSTEHNCKFLTWCVFNFHSGDAAHRGLNLGPPIITKQTRHDHTELLDLYLWNVVKSQKTKKLIIETLLLRLENAETISICKEIYKFRS